MSSTIIHKLVSGSLIIACKEQLCNRWLKQMKEAGKYKAPITDSNRVLQNGFTAFKKPVSYSPVNNKLYL